MNMKADKMRYQPNRLGYGLILSGMALSIVALFRIIIPTTIVPNVRTALEIIINIILMLLTFLGAERCKVYDSRWASIVIGFAVIHIVRIFWVPTYLLTNGQITGFQFTFIMVILLSAAALLIIGALVTIRRSTLLHEHLKQVGE